MNNYLKLSGCLLGALSLSLAAQAQNQPDAGSLLKQIERDKDVKLPQRGAIEAPTEPAALKPVSGLVVTVKEFRYAGNTLLRA